MISPQTICKAITVVRRGSPWRIASAVLSAERSNRVQIEGNTQIDDSKRCSSHSNTKQTSANYLQSNNSSKERESVEDCLSRFSSKHSNRVQIERNTQIDDSKRCSKHSNRVQTQSKHPQTICKAITVVRQGSPWSMTFTVLAPSIQTEFK